MNPSFPQPPWHWPRAAYIHVPFCAHHCGYCDFAVAVGKDDRIDRYLDALAAELSRLGSPQPVDTLFFGGGTPSHLSLGQLQRLCTLARKWFLLQPGHEFSIEANPDSLTADKINLLADHGVNRLSLGVQSFSRPLLLVLERRHGPEQIFPAVEAARRRIPQISLDLIFAVPGQSLAAWSDDLRQALDLNPDHVATYGLTFEKGTPLWKQRRAGRLNDLDENTELAMYETAIDVLGAAGIDQYEISNFARPGARCRHNQVYWANHAYFGAGVGAAAYVAGLRTLNTRELEGYLRRALANESIHQHEERLSPRERALETVGTQLRRREGIHRSRFQEQTGFDVDDLLTKPLASLIGLGFIVSDAVGLRLTRRGLVVADGVITELMKANQLLV